ncbi:MAG: hypothetical protein SH809_18380 [Rhodothermales bacterium]|nr:hypothetical protein [Rhodothermales bacterium]
MMHLTGLFVGRYRRLHRHAPTRSQRIYGRFTELTVQVPALL